MKTFNNPSVTAKLKAMYAKKLKKDDLDDLIKQEHIKDAIIILKSKIDDLDNLSNDAKRLELENSLDKLIIIDMKKIDKYINGTNKKIWQKYILKYKIDIIKKIYEKVITNELQNIENTIWVTNIFTDLEPLLKVKSKEEFLEQLPDEDIKEIFETSKNNFELENNLNKYYFEGFLHEVKGKNKDIETVLKYSIDLLNIFWTYRCQKYYGIVDENILINSFYKIDINIIREDVQKDVKRALYKRSKSSFRKDILNLNTVISYFEMIQIEKENIITIIEGIRYNLKGPTIKNKIII